MRRVTFQALALRILAQLVVPGLLWAGWAPALQAQGIEQPSEPPPEAIELYRVGREHYRAGRYREAITNLKAALALDPQSPNLIYNVAKVSELLGNLDEAIEYYDQYLDVLPGSETEERARIRETIARLRGARDELQQAAAAEPASELRDPGPAAPTPGRADTAFWITGGAGVALLTAGAVTGVRAVQTQKDVDGFVAGGSGDIAERDALVDKANRLAAATDVLLISGGAALTTAVLLYFLRDAELDEDINGTQVRTELRSDGRTTQLWLSGRF